MFCGNCGQQNPDDSVFCSNCGAALQTAPAVNPYGTGYGSDAAAGAPKGHDSKKIGLIAAVAGGAVALVLIIVLLVNVLGGGETKPVKTFLSGLSKCNVEKMLSAFPDDIIDDLDLDKSDIRDLQEDLKDEMDDEDIKISYDIKDTDDVKRSELRDMQDWYELVYDLEVTDAMTVKVKVTVESDGDKERETLELGVVKIKGKWYLDIYNNDMFYGLVGGYLY